MACGTPSYIQTLGSSAQLIGNSHSAGNIITNFELSGIRLNYGNPATTAARQRKWHISKEVRGNLNDVTNSLAMNREKNCNFGCGPQKQTDNQKDFQGVSEESNCNPNMKLWSQAATAIQPGQHVLPHNLYRTSTQCKVLPHIWNGIKYKSS